MEQWLPVYLCTLCWRVWRRWWTQSPSLSLRCGFQLTDRKKSPPRSRAWMDVTTNTGITRRNANNRKNIFFNKKKQQQTQQTQQTKKTRVKKRQSRHADDISGTRQRRPANTYSSRESGSQTGSYTVHCALSRACSLSLYTASLSAVKRGDIIRRVQQSVDRKPL